MKKSGFQQTIDSATWTAAQGPSWKRAAASPDDMELFWHRGERWVRIDKLEFRMRDLDTEAEQKWIDQLVSDALNFWVWSGHRYSGE